MRTKKERTRVVKLDAAGLRGLVEGIVQEMGAPLAGKSRGSLRKLQVHLDGARTALGELYQDARDPKASEQAHALLAALNRISRALDSMPELTGSR